jgi:RNA polymerase sigma factor (sigma-70 family)
MKRLLRSHPALPAAQTRELATGFAAAQSKVCRLLAALAYPLERIGHEIKAGHLGYFREGSDQDRKRNSGKKSSYRFAGFAPSHVEEFDGKLAERKDGRLGAAEFEAWQAAFLMRFTFEVIEQVSLRVSPAPSAAEAAVGGSNPRQARADLEEALLAARRFRDEILTGNLLLVAQIVSRRGRFYPTMVLDDLFTAGADGLMIAVGRYDPSVGLFSTYAMPWIKMAIDRYVAKTRNVIRIPIGLQEKVRQHRNKNGGAGGTDSEMEWLIPEVQSLEEPVPGFGEGELRLEDVVADPVGARPSEAVEQADIARILHERLAQLDPLKQFIIAMRNDIGDAAALAARLFREEAALSLGRGRSTAAAAAKTVDEPARIRLIGGIREAVFEEVAGEVEEIAIAV